MTVTNFIWDEQNYLAETDGSNAVQVVYTNEPQQYGNLISTRIGMTTYAHQYDALGSTRRLSDSSGTLTGDSWVYDAWGRVVDRTGISSVALQWIAERGYYNDADISYHAVRRRAYSPPIGRWTSVDPLPSSNPFCYSLNSPPTMIDPSGMLAFSYVKGRGTFTYIMLENGHLPNERGATFSLSWAPSDEWKSLSCRCSRVAIVQVVQSEQVYQAFIGPPWPYSEKWTVDGDIPYRHAGANGPTIGDPAVRVSLSMWDDPGDTLDTGPLRLIMATKDFEVCIACVDNMYHEMLLPGPIEVYSCMQWGYSYFSPKPQFPLNDLYSRYFRTGAVNQFTNKQEKQLLLNDRNGPVGMAPSDNWKQAVESFVSRNPIAPPIPG